MVEKHAVLKDKPPGLLVQRSASLFLHMPAEETPAWTKVSFIAQVPYGCLVPQSGVDNLLVAGRVASLAKGVGLRQYALRSMSVRVGVRVQKNVVCSFKPHPVTGYLPHSTCRVVWLY